MSLHMLIRDVTKVEIMPIKAATIFADTNFTCFMHPELESSFRITPITRKTSQAFDRTIAYKVEVTLYVPHVVYKKYGQTIDYDEEDEDASDYLLNRINELVAMTGDEVGGFQLVLILGVGAWNPGSMATSGIGVSNATDGVSLNLIYMGMNYEIESVEFRPRTILHFSGLFRKTSINSSGVEFNLS